MNTYDSSELNVRPDVQIDSKAYANWVKCLGEAAQGSGASIDAAAAAEEFAVPEGGGKLLLFARLQENAVYMTLKPNEWRFNAGLH